VLRRGRAKTLAQLRWRSRRHARAAAASGVRERSRNCRGEAAAQQCCQKRICGGAPRASCSAASRVT